MSAFDECLRGFVSRINQEPDCRRSTIVRGFVSRINQEPECRRSTSELFRHYNESSASCLLACLLKLDQRRILWSRLGHHYRNVCWCFL